MSMKWHLNVEGYPVAELVPSADGKKWVKPTMVQARKIALFPSLSSTIDVDKDQLVDWRINQTIFHCSILPYAGRFDGEDTNGHPDHKINQEDYKEYQDEILGRMKDDLNQWADDGKEVHANVEAYFRGEGWSGEATARIIEVLTPRLKELGVVKIDPERTIGGVEYGLVGTPDLPGYNADGKLVWIGDLKRKSEKQFKIKNTEASLGPNYQLQLGGYLWLLGGNGVQLDQVLSCRETNECKLVPYENSDRWATAFYHHWMSWKLRKDYDPTVLWKERGDELATQHAEIAEHLKWRVA